MKNKKTPDIRFKGFTDDWEQRKVGEVTEELSDYDNFSSGLPLLTSARTGIMYQSDYRGNCTTDSKNTLFSIVPLNACTYRHMSDDSTFHMNINTLEKGLVSREYPVFMGKNSDLRYIVRYINSSKSFMKFCTEQKKGGTRTRLYYKTLCEYQMMIPSLDEQHIIANHFEALDNLITLHQRKLEKLKNFKKAMLEKMFPKNGKKTPEIRFQGFTDDWEQRKVSDVAEIIAGGTPSTKNDEYWNPGEISWLSSGEVHKKYIVETNVTISQKGYDNSSARMVPAGSVLIALAGQGKTRGTVAITCIPLSTNQSIAAMIFNDTMYPQFVFSNLESRYDELRSISSGDGSRGGLNKRIVGNVIVPYTLRAEQKAIGNIFYDLDQLITLHQRKLEKLQQIKKAMLEKMFV